MIANFVIVYMLIFENTISSLKLDLACSSIQCEFGGVVLLNSKVGNICGIAIAIADSIHIRSYSNSVKDRYCLRKVGEVRF